MRSAIAKNRTWNPAILAFIGLSALDVFSTWVAIRAGMSEGNMLASAIMERAGLEAVFAFKLLVVFIVTACLVDLTPAYPRLWNVLKFANVFMALVVVFNTAQLVIG